MTGWAEVAGGGRLARLIAEAFARVDEREDEDDA